MNEKRLVFIHGFMGSALNWGRIRNSIESKDPTLKTYALDLLGHANRHPQDPLAYQDAHRALVEDLENQLKSIQATHVLVHSFGLRPALLLGQKNPALLGHLIVEDSSPELSASAHSFLKNVLSAPTPFNTREEAKEYFDTQYGAQTALSRFFLSNIKSTSNNLSDWRFDKRFLECLLDESLNRPLWSEWKAFNGQVSLIYGSNGGIDPNTVSKMSSTQKLHKVLPLHAGHWVHADVPDDFVSAVLSLIV